MPSTDRSSAGRVIAGISLAVVWAASCWILFYLVAVGGILTDFALLLIRTIMFPGWKAPASATDFAWSVPLETGFILAGAAGVPLGASLVWRRRAKLLRRFFWLLFLAGIAAVLFALLNFSSSAFAS
jgi:hypothetical protein